MLLRCIDMEMVSALVCQRFLLFSHPCIFSYSYTVLPRVSWFLSFNSFRSTFCLVFTVPKLMLLLVRLLLLLFHFSPRLPNLLFSDRRESAANWESRDDPNLFSTSFLSLQNTLSIERRVGRAEQSSDSGAPHISGTRSRLFLFIYVYYFTIFPEIEKKLPLSRGTSLRVG